MEKITQKVGFTRALDMYRELGDEEMVAFFEGRLAQLAKKGSGEHKLTPRQLENESIKECIINNMESGKQYTIADMMVDFEFPCILTVQRLSALLSQLGPKGTNQIVRTEVKGKAYFGLA